MSKIITFSRQFPSYHPRKGEPTYFVEKVLRSVHDDEHLEQLYRNWEVLKSLNMYEELGLESIGKFQPKNHTIRAGHRWKVGDWFSPRVWSGKPYNSKQIQFAPDIEIKKVWDFQIVKERDGILQWYSMTANRQIIHSQYHTGAEVWINDGLTYNEFCDWFKMDNAKKDIHFDGQIICWNENIEY